MKRIEFTNSTDQDMAADYEAPHLGPVVQSIVSLTRSLRGQLVKCFTLLPNILIFLLKKWESFCIAKASHIFSIKNNGVIQLLTL